jgi:hypothetical protein
MDNEDYLERVAILLEDIERVAILLEDGMAEDKAKQQALLELRRRKSNGPIQDKRNNESASFDPQDVRGL